MADGVMPLKFPALYAFMPLLIIKSRAFFIASDSSAAISYPNKIKYYVDYI